MSSRLNVKQYKKERPKSTDRLKKGRDKSHGTPENTATSESAEGLADSDTQRTKVAIINDEILALQIKPDDLEKLREPKPPSEERKKTPPPRQVTVRKLKPASEWNKPKPKRVTVARPAPQDAPLKDLDYGDVGPRYDDVGQIVPHSILGTVDEFKKMAQLDGTAPIDGSCTGEEKLTVKYEKKPRQFPQFESVDESNALRNWQIKMRDRKRQQNNLAKLLNKAPEQLVMNQSDNYRQTQELRYVIDRTLPTVDYGKGYRIGSEFWKQQERIGDDLTGIHATMTQSEKGYPAPIEHVGVPQNVLREKGTLWERPSTPCNKPWHRTAYLEERMRQLHPIMRELDPHQPDIGGLEVVGDSRPLCGPADVWRAESRCSSSSTSERPSQPADTGRLSTDREPALDADRHVFGPSLQFAGQPARWTGDSSSFTGQVGLEARVAFEEYANKRVTSYLEIVNDGSTAVFYDWKKVPKINPFEMAKEKVQRFYFNTGSGCILPGEKMNFPFVFKSPNPGVFSEQWEFQTRPSLCGGATLLVTLRGVALQQDKFKEERTQLERELRFRQATQVVGDILHEILNGLRPKERPRSPVDAYITEEEIFSRLNPGMTYHNERVKELQNLYRATYPEEDRLNITWELDVATLKDRIMAIDEDDDDKQDLLERLNKAMQYLSFPSFVPTQQTLYGVTYDSLCEMVDNLVTNASQLAVMLGMPERDADIPDDPSPTPPRSAKSRQSDMREGRESVPTSAKSAMSGDKDKKTPSQKTKPDPKVKIPSKETKPPPPKTGKESAKTPKSGTRPRSHKGEEGEDEAVAHDPVLEAKYRDKLYSQSYIIVQDSMKKLCCMLDDIQENAGGPVLPSLL